MVVSFYSHFSHQSNTLRSQLRLRSRHRGTLTVAGFAACVVVRLLFVKKSRSSKVNQASKTNCSQRCGQKNSAKFVRSLFDDRLVSGEQAKYESFSARMQLSVNNNKKENFIMYISVLPG